ncbi:hypothetical protein BD770DRAFT_405911 [Pilaira anomala]|nr:hypothetical protein BD770DRAFT_405911 [Pilaira anomala]
MHKAENDCPFMSRHCPFEIKEISQHLSITLSLITLSRIEHSSSVYENLRVLPIVLIISNKSSSSIKNNGEFSVIDNSFLMQCESKFWANKCFLFFRDDLVNVSMINTPTPALFTLYQFLSNPNKLLTLSHNLDTRTIHMSSL